ncbi:DUF2911 domain-containing protein [Rufibacter latericius]|uniref:DUF2911 domain-containing protein n=1 Tax=Rufibacter latericius TaxID=2487040 RepID=A0A3M9MES1_9BACT|nr:DUF2911 domain-containing protein [Rufibacter latericius]RNI24072.1 DUF2911 domain-containing protein [Rufibacter latericius]
MLSKVTFFGFLTTLTLVFQSCTQNPDTKKTQEKEATPAVSPITKAEDAATIQRQPEPDTLKGSLKAVATGRIGAVNLQVNYHSPAVRKRVVWGGLVAYGQVWVTGAHSATTLETDGPIRLGGTEIPAGKYALFTIPGEKEWTVILNRNWEQHLADEYAPKDDVVRLSVTPEETASHQERLRYEITSEGDDKGTVAMHWGRLRLPVPLEL